MNKRFTSEQMIYTSRQVESGVTPFCITFEQGAHEDEFQAMFEDTDYTIIRDRLSLPESMPAIIYKRLTF